MVDWEGVRRFESAYNILKIKNFKSPSHFFSFNVHSNFLRGLRVLDTGCWLVLAVGGQAKKGRLHKAETRVLEWKLMLAFRAASHDICEVMEEKLVIRAVGLRV